MEQSYNDDVEIDPEALDVEWTKQARLFMRYAEQCAEARREVARLKEAKDVVDADLSLHIRKNPAHYGQDKITEGLINAIITGHEKHVEAVEELAEAEHELDILTAAVRAMDQKKAALENLVRLQGQAYFAGPAAPRDLGREWAKETERNDSKNAVKKSLRRKGD